MGYLENLDMCQLICHRKRMSCFINIKSMKCRRSIVLILNNKWWMSGCVNRWILFFTIKSTVSGCRILLMITPLLFVIIFIRSSNTVMLKSWISLSFQEAYKMSFFIWWIKLSRWRNIIIFNSSRIRYSLTKQAEL